MVFTPPSIDVTDGVTQLNKALFDTFNAANAAALKGSVDQSPAATTDEVGSARGNFGSLDGRISSIVAADGTPVDLLQASAVRNGYDQGNLLANDTFLMWSQGDAAAPDHWALGGTGAAVARCGVGQSDTEVIANQAHYAAKVTFGSDTASLTQKAVIGGSLARSLQALFQRYAPVNAQGSAIAGYVSDATGMGAWLIAHVKCNGTNRARVRVSDPLDNVNGVASEFHPGDNEWHTLIAGPLPPTINRLIVSLEVVSAGTAYFQCAGLYLTPISLPPMWTPARTRYFAKELPVINNPATGTIGYMTFGRPTFIVAGQALCITAPGGTVPTIDFLVPISGTFQSMFVTKPQITAAQQSGTLREPDPAAANYRRRTVRGSYAAAAGLADNSIMRIDYVDDGSGTLRDLIVIAHCVQYDRPLEQFRSSIDLGE